MLLQRTIFRELTGTFLLSLGALLSLILVGRLLQLRDLLLGLDLGMADLGMLFVYLGPLFLLLVTPIAVMLAVFLTFLRMSTERELTALKACGVSLYQLLPAPAGFCLLVTGLLYLVSIFGISWGMDNFRTLVMELVRTKAQLTLQPGVFNRDFPGYKLYAERIDKEAGVMETVFVADRSRGELSAIITAGKGYFKADPVRGEIVLILEDGHIYSRGGGKLSVLSFGDYTVRVPLGNILKGLEVGEKKPKEMSLSELMAARDDPAMAEVDQGGFLRNVRVEMQKRLVQPLGCLALGLFALPWACVFRGLKQHYGVIIVFSLFFVYFSMLSMGISLGEAGALSPALGLWFPNVLFISAGAFGIRFASREKNVRIIEWFRHLRFKRGRAA